jgi:serine/threonine protein kinase
VTIGGYGGAREPRGGPASSVNKGDIVVGRYRLEDKLGMGGMGTVWSAEHIQTGRSFALKIMHATVAASDDSRERFLKEAKASARINHANVIDVLDVGELPDGGLFMAMELLDGLALSDALRLDPPLSIHELLVVLRDACAALSAAHGVGIIHRDVKPANIFLHRDKQTGYLRPKLLDFGVSKFSFLEESATHTGSLLGSPRYMSPEQARSATQADQRSDVWSVGVILFEGLIGAYPHEGDSFSNLVVAIATTPPRSAQAAVPSAERALTSLIDDCLRQRDTRIPSCEVLASRIDHILATRDLTNVPCARGKNKKSLARPNDFVVHPAVTAPPQRPSFQNLQRVTLDEPSTNPATTQSGARSHAVDHGEATSLFADPAAAATRPIHPMPVAPSGPSSILGPVPSRTMAAPPGGPLGAARADTPSEIADPESFADATPKRTRLPGGAQTLLSSGPLRPMPPPPLGLAQEATLIHTRMPQVPETSDSGPSSKAHFRTTVPMNGGLVAPPLVPPASPSSPASFGGMPAQTQLMPYSSPALGHVAQASGLGEARDQLVESVSTFNVERYRPGATPFSAPPPNDVDTTASRNRNRKASLLIVFGGASVVALAFVVIFLMGRTQPPPPAAPAAPPVEASPMPRIEPTPPAAPDPAPEPTAEDAPIVEEPAASASAASSAAVAPSATAAPSASQAKPPTSAPTWTPPPGYQPPPNGRLPPKKDCSKDPIGCLDSGLK